MKCASCGAENPDDKRFCGDCGSPLKSGESLSIKLKKRIAYQTAVVIALVSVLLMVIGLGFLGEANHLDAWGGDVAMVGHSFFNLAWFFGWLGVAGFVIAGLALLFSYPTLKSEKKVKSEPASQTPDKEK